MSETNKSTFDKNIEALILKNQELATQLFAIEENKRYEVYQGSDPVDINFHDKEANLIMYDKPTQAVLDYIDEHTDYERYPFRYFFGIGNGVLIKMLLNSAFSKRITVIEPNIELLYIVLSLLDFSEAIESEKVQFDLAENIDFIRALHYISHNEAKIYVKLFKLEVSTGYYSQVYGELLDSVNKTFIKAISHSIMSHGNDIVDSIMGIEHHFQNLPTMIKNPKFKELLKKKNSDTAIVVSTGPSLNKQLPLLKEIQDYVTIISVDASFPILEKHGIKPDIVTVLERVPTTANFFKKTSPEFQKDVIFLLVSIVHEDLLNAIVEGTKVLVMRPHEYTQYFELDEFGYLGSGMSAANLAHELAVSMQYKRAILIGQDLAFGEDGKSHAKDHFFGENEEDSSKFEFTMMRYGGEGQIKSTMYWKLFKDFFEKLIVSSSSFFDTYNATEGGARIEGAIEMPFKEVVAKYIDKNQKEKITLSYPTQDEIEKYRAQILEKTKFILTEAREKQEVIEKTFIKVQEESENLVKLKNEKRLEDIDFDHLASLVEEIDKIKVFVDEPLFTKMFYDAMRSTLIHQELDIAKLQVKPVKEDIDKKAKMIEWIMVHRYWLFLFAGTINAQREVMVRAIETWDDTLKKEIDLDIERESLSKSGRELNPEEKEIFKMTWLQEDGTYK